MGGFRFGHRSHKRGQVRGTVLKTGIICENLCFVQLENIHLQTAFPWQDTEHSLEKLNCPREKIYSDTFGEGVGVVGLNEKSS